MWTMPSAAASAPWPAHRTDGDAAAKEVCACVDGWVGGCVITGTTRANQIDGTPRGKDANLPRLAPQAFCRGSCSSKPAAARQTFPTRRGCEASLHPTPRSAASAPRRGLACQSWCCDRVTVGGVETLPRFVGVEVGKSKSKDRATPGRGFAQLSAAALAGAGGTCRRHWCTYHGRDQNPGTTIGSWTDRAGHTPS
jgi:hypothetical protein